MSPYLLDVNLLLALSWHTHRFHNEAQHWFLEKGHRAWATCPLTQAAYVRLSSNPAFSSAPVSPRQAMSILQKNLEHPGHRFWPDAISFVDAVSKFQGEVKGHQQVSDAYLLGLAISNHGKLATLDTRVASLIPEEYEPSQFVELVV